MIKPPVRTKPKVKAIRLDEISGGLNVQYQEHRIKDTQSPFILNLNADDRGALTKRKGQRYVFTSLGDGAINALAYYKDKLIFVHGTKIYTQVESNEPVEIYSGISNAKGFFFKFNGLLYFQNGTDFLVYDGATVSKVEDSPYIPTIQINRHPNGESFTVNEDWNLIGNKAKIKFSATGTDTVYKLPKEFLPLEAVTDVKVNETPQTPIINLTTGEITFSQAPSGGVPNNVEMTIQKTFPQKPLIVKKCTRAIEYMGRIFMWGNSDQPNGYIISGLKLGADDGKANYFPENLYNKLTSSDEALVNCCTQYDKLIMFKEKSIHVTSTTVVEGLTKFPVSLLNGSLGCDIPDSVQLIDNNPVFANTYGGVHIIKSTLIEGEKNVDCVSQNINGTDERQGLLDQSNLKEATSLDHHGKYYLCVNDKVYMWDYSLSPYKGNPDNLTWFFYDNIKANNWIVANDTVYYGHREIGSLVQFINAYNDFGNPIKGVFRSKLYDFEYPEYLKRISELWLKTRPNSGKIKITYYMDRKTKEDSKEILIKSFNWDTVTWDTWTWDVYRFPPTIKRRPNLNDVSHFQIEFENSGLNENLSILNLVINVTLTRKVR